jgi:regulator of protease activity HflC (stomatin/prohibitin superfamily)
MGTPKVSDATALEAESAKAVTRYEEGWRAGKPVEDPAKLKRWGFITAKPSEYLIVVRNGSIDHGRSGQGMRVWKWPWNAVAIVPTTLQQIDFAADQITRERVGVSVSGLAVYRIVQPEIAYRMLNFTFGERASEKLAYTLREMFIGAARRLIANLTLDQCLMNRKESIASFLMQEIAPVVSGSGRPEDTTDQGWGVLIDTIEIQDVKIMSRQVFEHLQAPYRAEIAMKAEMAELERQRQVSERRSATERQTAEAAIMTQRETRILKARAEAEASEKESAEALRAEQAKARVQADELERKEALARKRLSVEEGIALRQAESKAAVDVKNGLLKQEQELGNLKAQEQKRLAAAQLEMAALGTEAELAEKSHQAELRRHQLEQERRAQLQDAQLRLQQQKARVDEELRRREADTKAAETAGEVAHQRALAEIEQMVNQSRALRELVTQGLPQMANAFKQSFGTINYTQLSGAQGSGPLDLVGGAIAQLLTVARSFGLDPARLGQPIAAAASVDSRPDGAPGAPKGS